MKKLLLMGYSGVGKTSMHSVIFGKINPSETSKIGYTVSKQQNKYKLGDLQLNIWDCGGNDTFMDQNTGRWLLGKLKQNSPNALVFLLIHKTDKLQQSLKHKKIKQKQLKLIQIAQKIQINITKSYGTSIWDETLYQSWSEIVQMLIPNRQVLQKTLKVLQEISMCSEVVLFERETFLVLCKCQEEEKEDLLKYEKVANLVKQFKITCLKRRANIENFEIISGNFAVMIFGFTKSENIMVIFEGKFKANSEILGININNLAKNYENRKLLNK